MRLLPALLALGVLAPAQEGWWKPGWKHRRTIILKNGAEADLKTGYPIAIEIDLDYLGLREKVSKDLRDLAIVHRGSRIPCALLPGRKESSRTLWFRSAADLAAGAKDAGYALYYGNPAAAPEAASPEAIFDAFQDFSDPDDFRRMFDVDRDLTCVAEDGALVIRDVSPERSEMSPARIVLKRLPSSPGFSLSLDLEIDASNAAPVGLLATVDMKDAGVDEKELKKKIGALIETLGDVDWQEREKATRELIRIGKPALPLVIEAARSNDAEVKWRAEHIVKEMREKGASATIAAGVSTTPSDLRGQAAILSQVGASRTRASLPGGWPLRIRLTILRDPEGDVLLLWNDGNPKKGVLKGEVAQIGLSVWKTTNAPLGKVRIDNVTLRRHVHDDHKPTHVLEVEEARP